MNKRSPNEFQRDIEMRQRNIVYPDTLRNETRGWRSLITSKKPLSVLQVVGLLALYLCMLSMLVFFGELALSQYRNTSGTGVGRAMAGFGGYVIVLVLCGAVFLLFRWRVRKALVATHKRVAK